MLTLPGPDATLSELVAHAAQINALLASRGYYDRLLLCQGCGRGEENKYGREFGHARYCSKTCEEIMKRLARLRDEEMKRRVIEGPKATPLKRRRRKAS